MPKKSAYVERHCNIRQQVSISSFGVNATHLKENLMIAAVSIIQVITPDEKQGEFLKSLIESIRQDCQQRDGH